MPRYWWDPDEVGGDGRAKLADLKSTKVGLVPEIKSRIWRCKNRFMKSLEGDTLSRPFYSVYNVRDDLL